MLVPVSFSRHWTARPAWIAARLVLLLLLVGGGGLLLSGRPGLKAEYFALGEPWQGKPINVKVGEPRLASASDVANALMTKVVFSVRWSGWWAVEQEGEHRLSIDADDGGYLRVDDEIVVDTSGLFGEPRPSGLATLRPGFHQIEIGLFQNYGASRLAVHWLPPGATPESASPLPLDRLYVGRPLLLRQALRHGLAGWPRVYRQLLGVVLLLAAAALLRGMAASFAAPLDRLRTRLRALDGRAWRTGLLLALFVVAFAVSLPLTGTVRGGDDTSYLATATFNEESWFFNRYGHVYLLKLFTALSGGDPLVGVRVWWSFAFAVTVAALAVAVASVGPGLQLRTLAVTLFVFLAQTSLFGLIGAGFADFSAMMFVTAAVATYLHGPGFARDRPPPRHEWHALLIGILTVGACRSKEVGAVLLLLPLLFLFGRGGLDLRRFALRMAYWIAGALAALLTLMLLDWWILGDFLFTLDGQRFAASDRMNFPTAMGPRKASDGWLHILWDARLHEANFALRNLWLGVCAGALAVALRRRRLELRLLHLLPIAYLLALIAIYIRMPHPFSPRMLITILPVASLMTALALHYAGLDEVPWGQALKPSVFVPTTLAVAALFLVVVPYRLGTLEAGSLLPVGLLSRYGWAPEQILVNMLLPAVFLLAVGGAALVVGRQRARVAALLVVCVALFGTGFQLTRDSLANNWAAQVGQLLLHPWKTFRDELNAASAQTIGLSRDLRTYFQMSAQTQASIAALVLGRRVQVLTAGDLPATADHAIASTYVYDVWRARTPALTETAETDAAGFLVLVRPRQALERAGRQPAEPAAAAHASQLERRLAELKLSRDAAARADLLRWILDRLEGPFQRGRSLGMQYLDGERLRAVALSRDGWTEGVNPAGLVLRNLDEKPWAPQLRLTVHAEASEYPIRVVVDDGEEAETVRFDRGGSRKLRLKPVPRGASRLVLVWSDTAWASRNSTDGRRLGVRIRVVPEPGG